MTLYSAPVHENVLFLGTDRYAGEKYPAHNEGDKPHLPRLKPIMKGKRTFIDLRPVNTIAEVETYCKHPQRNITAVLSTSRTLLSRFVGKPNPSLDSYAGSYFIRNGIEYVFIDPLEQFNTVPYGEFLISRFASKIVSPESWLNPSEFRWKIVTDSAKRSEAISYLSQCELLAVDIETFRSPLSIRCIGYTGLKNLGDRYESFSYVLPMDCMENLYAMRQINSNSSAKILQNGKYDISYLARYNATLHNYLWDTAALFHSWYSELPKDLAFLQSFFVRTAAYWKDLADTNDLEQYYLYNAKDTWATAHVFLAWIKEAPAWAHTNYIKEFPLQFACHLSEMTGVQRDIAKLHEARQGIDNMVARRSASLDKILGTSGFNVNSAPQMKQLMTILGCADLVGAGDKQLAKAAFRHPLNARIIDIIRGVPKTDNLELMGIRALRKAKSTYLRTDEDADKKEQNGSKEFLETGRILYALNPHGTDSGRLASKEHHFWCGFNIQNIPVGNTIKQTIVADPGFLFGECDLEQAEARDVAYISGDESLIAAVSGHRDFHSTNASAFFGVPYESIYDDGRKKTLNKILRNLAKRVNHGANYNMGPDVLVDTMGEKAIYEAGVALKLPARWTAREIAVYLLDRFDKTYPVIRGPYHKWIVEQITVHKKLVGATGWTRYCFSNPKASKQALNSYVAHPSQSLNAMVLNEAYMKVFYDLAIHPEHRENFKLCAQIHDSILFQYRIGHEYLAEEVRKRMEIPVTVVGADGKLRKFTVPAASKIGGTGGAKYWSETE